MRLLLPPSETKRTGGAPHQGRFALSFSVQDPGRADLLTAVEELCRDDPDTAVKVLGLGPKSASEIELNRFDNAPVLPAIDRYTGVLYSAIDTDSWSDAQRQWAAEHVFIHSALFGIVSSADAIPAYRLSYNTRLNGRALSSFWLGAPSEAIGEAVNTDWVLDARSDGYRSLAPIPDGVRSLHLEVVSADGGKALNHFNKVHKGELVSAVVRDMPDAASPEAFVEWANGVGFDMQSAAQTVTLVV